MAVFWEFVRLVILTCCKFFHKRIFYQPEFRIKSTKGVKEKKILLLSKFGHCIDRAKVT